jgi:ComF family protein
MKILSTFTTDFLSLFYPRLCHACQKALVGSEECLCSFCHFHLPQTHLHKERENSVTRILWGRVDVETATSLFYFQKGGKVQKLIHQFKYKGKRDIGLYLGKLLGHQLRESPLWEPVDVIVPVPMHPRKQYRRGFNQSEIFARGIGETLNRPLLRNKLVKVDKTDTQTRKTRFRRWENVEGVFQVNDPEAFRGKNILLVDDVITTGSTLEACASKLKEIKGTRLWIATIAVTT